MTRAEFVDGLKALGFDPVEPKGKEDFVVFPYEIRVGKFAGQTIQLGLQVFDLNPPGGPHVCPRLRPLHPSNDLPHPEGGIHASPLGDEWQYWSRPYPNWDLKERSARTYMDHINKLFAEQ
jgi:hypothetical protein